LEEVLGTKKHKQLYAAIIDQNCDNEEALMRTIAEVFADHIHMSVRMGRIILRTADWTPIKESATLYVELSELATLLGEPIAKIELTECNKRLGQLYTMKNNLAELTAAFTDIKASKQLDAEIAEVERQMKKIERDYPNLRLPRGE